MMRKATAIAVVCCLLSALSGCGNKGPLVPADEEKPQNSATVAE